MHQDFFFMFGIVLLVLIAHVASRDHMHALAQVLHF